MLKYIQNWKEAQSGAATIEFALLVFPFLLVLLAIIELGFMFAASVILEGSTHAAARVVRTGQVQGAADPVTFFQDAICNEIGGLITCNDIVHEVIPVPDGSFASAGAAEFDADGNMVSRGFDPGGVSDVVVVRASYLYEFATPLLGMLLSPRGDNAVLLMSTVTIRNEPYDF